MKRSILFVLSSFLGLSLLLPAPSQAKRKYPLLSLPIDCQLGKDCFIQNYADLDPSKKKVLDANCGRATYDTHKGTDFALRSLWKMKQGVAVKAVMTGRVVGMRNSMKDSLIRTPKQRKAMPRNRYCGNQVVIRHGNGWMSQYCHMRKGSVKVKVGQPVKRGQVIGLIGISGMTQFPHVHLTMLHHRKVIDPFTGNKPNKKCLKAGIAVPHPNSLWSPAVIKQLPRQTSFFLRAGLANHKISRTEIRNTKDTKLPVSTKSPMLLIYAYVANVQKGDQLLFKLTHQQKDLIHSRFKISGQKARLFRLHGKRRRSGQWPPGKYHGHITLIRKGKPVLQKKFETILE